MKNLFGDEMITCPACETRVCETGIRNHIMGCARSELWKFEMEKGITETPHLDYYRKNFKEIKSKKLIIK